MHGFAAVHSEAPDTCVVSPTLFARTRHGNGNSPPQEARKLGCCLGDTATRQRRTRRTRQRREEGDSEKKVDDADEERGAQLAKEERERRMREGCLRWRKSAEDWDNSSRTPQSRQRTGKKRRGFCFLFETAKACRSWNFLSWGEEPESSSPAVRRRRPRVSLCLFCRVLGTVDG